MMAARGITKGEGAVKSLKGLSSSVPAIQLDVTDDDSISACVTSSSSNSAASMCSSTMPASARHLWSPSPHYGRNSPNASTPASTVQHISQKPALPYSKRQTTLVSSSSPPKWGPWAIPSTRTSLTTVTKRFHTRRPKPL